MSDGFNYQLSVKIGPHGSHMLNLRANTEAEFVEVLAAADRQAGYISLVADSLCAESVGGQPVAGAAPVAAAPYSPRPEVAAPQAAPQQAAQAPQSSAGGYCGPNGGHGPRVRKTGGVGADTWAGWFCPLGKADRDRCKPVYDR